MNSLKILITVDNLSKHWWIQKIAFYQAVELVKLWHHVDFLCHFKSKHELKHPLIQIRYSNIKRTNNIIKKISDYIRHGYTIWKLSNKYEVFIWHWWDSWIPTLISKIFWNKKKVFYWQHSSTEMMNKSAKVLYYLFFRFAYRIIAVSKEDCAYIRKKYPKASSNYINNFFIEKKQDSEHLEKKYNHLFWSKTTFLHIWALEKYKQQNLLIEVFNLFNKKKQDVQLLIIGTWSLEQELKSYANKENIHFLWFQENTNWFIKKSNCLTMSSKYEGLPLSLIDGLCLWKPIISTNIKTWIKELISWKLDNPFFWKQSFATYKSWIISQDDVVALYESIKYYTKHKTDFSINKDILREQYSLQKHIESLQELL